MRRLRRGLLPAAITLGLLAALLYGGQRLHLADAVTLTDVLKLGGVALAVSGAGTQLDGALRGHHPDASAAKVVPIYAVAQGRYVGAAQVVGPPAQIRRVHGVAALDQHVGALPGNVLLPISTPTATRAHLPTVPGVDVATILDFAG